MPGTSSINRLVACRILWTFRRCSELSSAISSSAARHALARDWGERLESNPSNQRDLIGRVNSISWLA